MYRLTTRKLKLRKVTNNVAHNYLLSLQVFISWNFPLYFTPMFYLSSKLFEFVVDIIEIFTIFLVFDFCSTYSPSAAVQNYVKPQNYQFHTEEGLFQTFLSIWENSGKKFKVFNSTYLIWHLTPTFLLLSLSLRSLVAHSPVRKTSSMLMKRVLQWWTCQLDVLQVAPHSTRDEGRYQGPREDVGRAIEVWREHVGAVLSMREIPLLARLSHHPGPRHHLAK